jgi:hypothetical protein
MKPELKEELIAYKEYGRPICLFIQYVLENNLIEAVFKADEQNSKDLREIIRYVNDELPWSAWGGPERIKRWIKRGGLVGIRKGNEALNPYSIELDKEMA